MQPPQRDFHVSVRDPLYTRPSRRILKFRTCSGRDNHLISSDADATLLKDLRHRTPPKQSTTPSAIPEELHRYVLDHPRDPLPDMSSDAGSSHTYERQSSQRHSYSPTPHPPSLTPATFPREDSTEPGPSSHPPSEWSSTDEARTSSWRSHEGREATHPLEGRWSAEEGYGLTPPHRSHEFQTSTLCEAIFTRLSNLPGLMDSQGGLFLTALQRGQETDAGLITSCVRRSAHSATTATLSRLPLWEALRGTNTRGRRLEQRSFSEWWSAGRVYG